jgi:hypothetical protein
LTDFRPFDTLNFLVSLEAAARCTFGLDRGFGIFFDGDFRPPFSGLHFSPEAAAAFRTFGLASTGSRRFSFEAMRRRTSILLSFFFLSAPIPLIFLLLRAAIAAFS